MLSILLLVLAAVPFAILWKIRKSKHDGWLYLLASLSILFLTAALLAWAPEAYTALGGTGFMPTAEGEGAFDTQSYSGFLQILFGVPVAVAGSLYAILLARQSERQSSQFNAYEIRKNFRDRLEERNAAVGRFAKSLRDINNTCYILLAQVDRALAALPEGDGDRDKAAANVRKETARIEENGVPMLRAALEDYRDAAIAVQEGGIILDKSARPPLDTIKWHFYEDQKGRQELVDAILARDYQATADRFLVRAYRLSARDLIRARLERMVQSIVRWSEDPDLHQYWKDLRVYVMSFTDVTTADISGADDHVGFRFIGPALIRADGRRDRQETWRLFCRVDLGTAILLDSYLALPSKEQSIHEIQQWDEWTFLKGVVDEDERRQLLTAIPDRDQHFPQVFSAEVAAIKALYSYLEEAADDRKSRAIDARMDYRALFYNMPPDWLDTAYEDLAARIDSDAPPSMQELADHLACIAATIQIVRIDNARSSGMAAINRIVQAIGGAVERQFTKLGAAGQREFRRCLLVMWAEQTEHEQRLKVLGHLQQLLSASTDMGMSVQLHLDLFDCDLALGHTIQAARHFADAQAILAGMTEQQLNDAKWRGHHKYSHPEVFLEPRIVLLSVWLSGYLMKQPGEFLFEDNAITELEIAMPDGFLPAIWSVLARMGLISLPGGAQPLLIECPQDCFLSYMIKRGQGEWDWRPELVSAEIAKRLEIGRQAGQASFLQRFCDEWIPN
jgi:hypothetical protein